jgi:HK97 family phage major capsid protein
MPYNSIISRGDAAGTIPVEYSAELVNTVSKETSHILRLGRRLRDMTVYEKTMPVLSALATAYFPGGDSNLVQTSEVNWADVTLTAEDIAVLVPIPKNVLNDANVPIWEQIQPIMATAAGAAIDKAVLYGTNKPSTWPSALITGALAASHNVSLAGFTDLYDAVLGATGMFALVESDGFGVNGVMADLSMKGQLRGTRDTEGQPIFTRDPAMAGQYMLDGAPIYFPTNGAGSSTYKMIAGDWQQIVFSMRQDMEFEVFTEGVIQDGAGTIVLNLMQQRSAALMLTMRLAVALPNPINWVNTNGTTRYPFAYLTA